MRSGIAGRADAGAQARQFNATPTPATALPAIHDRGAPRPARRPGLQLASSISDEDASHDAGRAGAAAPQHELGKWMPRPRLGDAAPARPAAWRAPLGRWLETGLRRPETGLPWPENGSSITATQRGTCPGTPGNFAGVPGTVAGDRSHGGRKSGPAVAGNRVPRRPDIGSSITATHRATCPGTPGNFAGVPGAVAGDGSRGGRKSGLRYRVYIGPSASPTFFPDQATVPSTPTPAAGPWAPCHLAPPQTRQGAPP